MKVEGVYDTCYTVECPLLFLWPYHTKSLIKNKHGKSKGNSYGRKYNSRYVLVEDEFEDLTEEKIFEDFNFNKGGECLSNISCNLQHKKETFSLGLFIKEKKKTRKPSNLRKRNCNIDQKNFKGNKVYVAGNSQKGIYKSVKEVMDLKEENSEINTTAELNKPFSEKNTENEIQEFTDYFNATELNGEKLQKSYQNLYLESNYYPRSFAVINYKQSKLSVSVNIYENMIDNLQKISLRVFNLNHFD